MNLGLKDCKAFISGASKGLGRACAKALAGEGVRVFICGARASCVRIRRDRLFSRRCLPSCRREARDG